MIDKKQPIIIKKVVKGGHGHHGGAWKVAFADFATAMMAFFLLMWLMGGTSDEEKAAISQYFENPSLTQGTAPTVAPSAVHGPGGASTGMIDMGGGLELFKEREKEKQAKQEITEEEVQQDQQRLDELMEKLKAAIEKSQALAPYKDQLLLDITPEGLRIQIVDKENRPMFDSGQAHLKYYTYQILQELAHFVNEVPNRISISGHTDATPFLKEDYGNWELSADRANTARRALIDGGLKEAKIGRVVGLASSALFDKENPRNPINRRIAIIVLNKKTDEAISKGEGVTEKLLQERSELFDQVMPEPGEEPSFLEGLTDIPGDVPAETPRPPVKEQAILPPQPQSRPQSPSQSRPQPEPKESEPSLELPMEYL